MVPNFQMHGGMMPGGTGMMPGGGLMPGAGMMPGMVGLPNPAGLLAAGNPAMMAGLGLPPNLLPGMQPPPPPAPPPGEAMTDYQKQKRMLEVAAGCHQEEREAEASAPLPGKPDSAALDPEVKKLCDHFQIEADCAAKLDEVVRRRPDTKESDLAQLYDILDDVGSPTCLLELKIGDMESGEFVGKVLEDREAMALSLNYGLNEEATQKLYELASCRATKKGEDLVRMELLLEHTTDPSGTAARFAGQVLKNEIEALPDLSEAKDVIKKFELDKEARQKLIEIVLARTEDSSALLGGLEVYFEGVRNPSSRLVSLSARLLAGGDVPDPQDERRKEKADDRERERDRDRDRQVRTRRSPSVAKKKSRSRSRRSSSRKKRSRSKGRRK